MRDRTAPHICPSTATEHEAGQSPLKRKYGLRTKNKVETNHALSLVNAHSEAFTVGLLLRTTGQAFFPLKVMKRGERNGRILDFTVLVSFRTRKFMKYRKVNG